MIPFLANINTLRLLSSSALRMTLFTSGYTRFWCSRGGDPIALNDSSYQHLYCYATGAECVKNMLYHSLLVEGFARK